MLRRITILTAFLGALGAFMSAPALAGSITVGQAAGNTPCSGGFTVFQPPGSVSYSAPSGNWTMTSWSTQAGSSGGQMAVVILRPIGGGSYTVVNVGPTQTLTPNTLNTFGTYPGSFTRLLSV